MELTPPITMGRLGVKNVLDKRSDILARLVMKLQIKMGTIPGS
jgi:hypothetical protein